MSSQVLQPANMEPCLEYVWPPAVISGQLTVLNVCVCSSQASRRVRCIMSEPDAGSAILLDAEAELGPGCTTVRIEVEPRPAGSSLMLQVMGTAQGSQARHPASVPIVALAPEAVQELSNLFDREVQKKLTSMASESAAQGKPARTTAEAVQAKNSVVAEVYCQVMLPLLSDMHVVITDAPYHRLRAACMRLAPVLKRTNLPNCLSILREFVRVYNDTGGTSGDEVARLLLPSAPQTPSNSVPNSNSSTVTTSQLGVAGQLTERLRTDNNAGWQQGSQPSNNPSPPIHDTPATLATVCEGPASSSQQLPEPSVQSPAGTVQEQVPGNGVAADSTVDAETAFMGDLRELILGAPGQQHHTPRLQLSDHLPHQAASFSRMPDTDEELDLLFDHCPANMLSTLQSSDNVVLTSYVPGQDEHIAEAPGMLLAEPEEPVSIDTIQSDLQSGINQLVTASHELQDLSGLRNPTMRVVSAAVTPVMPSSAAHSDKTPTGSERKASSGETRSSMGSNFRKRSSGASHFSSGRGSHTAHQDAVASLPASSSHQDNPVPVPSLRNVALSAITGFPNRQLEKQFRRDWSNSTWLMDVATFVVVLTLTVVALHGGPYQGDVRHGMFEIFVAVLACPMLIATELLAAHRKATVKHRELIVASCRLMTSLLMMAMLGTQLYQRLPPLHFFMQSRACRVIAAHLKTISRPMLLRNAVVCTLLDSIVFSAAGGHTMSTNWLLESMLIWSSTLFTTFCLDAYSRKVYLQQLTTSHRFRQSEQTVSSSDDSSSGTNTTSKTSSTSS